MNKTETIISELWVGMITDRAPTITRSVFNNLETLDDIMVEDPSMTMEAYDEIRSVRIGPATVAGAELYAQGWRVVEAEYGGAYGLVQRYFIQR